MPAYHAKPTRLRSMPTQSLRGCYERLLIQNQLIVPGPPQTIDFGIMDNENFLAIAK